MGKKINIRPEDLRMTRTSVATTDRGIFKPWNIQHYFLTNEDYAVSNKNIISDFKEQNVDCLVEEKYGEGNPYIMLKSLTYQEVYRIFYLFISSSIYQFIMCYMISVFFKLGIFLDEII